MLSWSLAVALATAMVADLSTEALIERLGSSDRVVREEAARTLEERGPNALPALRAARDAADDARARGRLAELVDRAEARLLDRPTLVTLDFNDRPLGEAIQTLADRSGFSLVLDNTRLTSRRVTIRTPGPLPFWEALDRLGRAGHVRHDPSSLHNALGRDPLASTIRLIDGDPPALTTYPGPLRVHLFATHWHRDISFEPATAEPPAGQYRTSIIVEVQAFAEPGRFIDVAGPPRLEAVDDKDRPLAPHPGGGDWPPPAERSWLISGRLSLLNWHMPLALPDRPDRTPLRLRGVLPLIISVRRPDPLVIPLPDAVGKTFRQDGSSVRVESISTNNPHNPLLMLVLNDDSAEADRARASFGPQADHLSEFVHNRLEFEDAEGHPMNWLLPGQPFASTNGEFRAQIHLWGPAPVARLRVYRLRRLATELPIAFDDAPAP